MTDQIYSACRHWEPTADRCVALGITAPRRRCKGCEMFEPNGRGLGDVVEKVIDILSAGQAKKIAAKKGDCGCAKRRAKLNRMSSG